MSHSIFAPPRSVDLASAPEIYAARILKSRAKKYRECRTDIDHEQALFEVYEVGYRRGLWDLSSAENKARNPRP